MDINWHATQLAASNLTLGAPSVNYEAMSLHTLQHGPQPDGTARLGSLELLRDAVAGRAPDLFGVAKTARVVDRGRPERHGAAPDLRNQSVVLMNPPYTANDKRGRKYHKDDLKRMQREEQNLREAVARADRAAGAVIDFNSVSTFFTPMADALLKKDAAVLGVVRATTACTSTSGLAERKFLASRFHVDVIVTTHDPKRPNLSENTSIHESLLVCRRKTKRNADAPTLFVSLARKVELPSEIEEIRDWVTAVHERRPHKWHALFEWPEERIAQGDWSPAQWFDGELAFVADEIESLASLRPLGEMALVEPAGRRIRGAMVNPLKQEPKPVYPVMWRHQTGRQTTMRTTVDCVTEPKSNRRDYAINTLWPKASRLLVAARIRTTTVRTSSAMLDQPGLGSVWAPVTPRANYLRFDARMSEQGHDTCLVRPSPEHLLQHSAQRSLRVQKAWCAFLNSTPGVVLFLNRRSKTLTYPAYSLDQLRALPCPDPRTTDASALADAFDRLQDQELRPWPEMDRCPVRAELDAVVGRVVGLGPDQIAEWRRKLVLEPTISNRARAPDP